MTTEIPIPKDLVTEIFNLLTKEMVTDEELVYLPIPRILIYQIAGFFETELLEMKIELDILSNKTLLAEGDEQQALFEDEEILRMRIDNYTRLYKELKETGYEKTIYPEGAVGNSN